MKKLNMGLCAPRTLSIVITLFAILSFSLVANAGTGVVTVTSNDGSCLAFSAGNGNGPDNWEVAEGGNYTMTISGVTECTGDAITVFVQNADVGNFCFNATGGAGTYSASFTMPSPTCFTSPISYKCGADQPCDNSGAIEAQGPSGNAVHLRAAIFDGSCNKTDDDVDCQGGEEPPCICTPPANIIITAIGNDQIQVCWDPQDCAIGYILQYQWKGHITWNIIDITAPDVCAIISLNGHTTVTIEVATVCEDSSVTDYTVISNYQYTACAAPTDLSTTNITATTATFNWTPGTTTNKQKVRYQKQDNTSPVVKWVFAGVTSLDVSGLLPSTDYKWKVEGDCWSPYLKFTTAAQKPNAYLTSEGTINELSVYPNPASEKLYVDIQMNDQEDYPVLIQLVNMMGQVVFSGNDVVAGGHSVNTIDLDDQVQDGVYFIRVISGEQNMYERIVINSSK